MNVMRRLLRVFRRDLWIYLGVEAAIVFLVLIALNEVHPKSPASGSNSLGVAAFLALFLCLCLRTPSRLNRMPFPVSVEQSARLPMLAFMILWCTGISVILIVVMFFGFSPVQWLSMARLMLLRAPLYLLAFLWVYRLMQMTPHLVGLAFLWVFLPPLLDAYNGGSFWAVWYFPVLPVVLGMIVFYWIEIPKQLANQDRLLIAQGHSQSNSMRDLNIDSRQTAMAWIANTINAVIFFALVVWGGSGCLSVILRQTPNGSIQGFMSKPWLCLFPLLGVCLGYKLLGEAYRRAVASGFGPYSAALMTLMQMTIVLGPLAQALGVKKGIIAQCDQCHTSKFIWSLRCPHCGFPGPGTILNKQMARLARGSTVRITMRQKILFRLFIPAQLLIMFGVFGVVGNRPFEAHTTLLTFQDAQIAAQAVVPVKDWIEARAEAADLLVSNGFASQKPEKYRVQVVYYQGNAHMTLEAYGLRWDSVESLPAFLAEALKEVCVFTTLPMKPRRAGSPFMQTRTFLDNQIHWVERENSLPRKISKNVSAPLPKRVE